MSLSIEAIDVNRRLTQLWHSDMPSLAIAASVGVTINALYGYVRRHRTDLPQRPRRYEVSSTPRELRPHQIAARAREAREGGYRDVPKPVQATLPPLPSVVGVRLLSEPVLPASRCQMPLWSGRPDGRFCSAPSRLGRSYCERCCGIAFDRRPAR